MEEAKLQALHDSLAKIRGRKGLGTSGNQFSWQKTTESSSNNLPKNVLYAHFVPEGSYDPNAIKGDGRVVKRDFSDCLVDDDKKELSLSKEERKRRRKEEKKAVKLQAKREAKLAEKRRLKAAMRVATPHVEKVSTVSDDSLELKTENGEKKKEKKAKKSKEKKKEKEANKVAKETVDAKSSEKKAKKRKRDAQVAAPFDDVKGEPATKTAIIEKKSKKKSKKKDKETSS